ncbi:hypothetical protein CPB86DRAFT_823550 [Serendipita vermifera]|nr:hypothetical protein CPB86DRAFT_823550 [Serendipita vermifera]
MQLPLEPFHRPSPSEIRQIQSKIAQNAILVREIDQKIQELLQQRHRIDGETAICYSILAPARRLTFDVLARIFLHYVDDQEGSPWVLAHVCRTWRTTALTSPSLWTGLHLELSPQGPDPTHSRRVGRREYCATVKHLELALQRSSNNLLDVKLVSPPQIPLVVRAHIPTMLHIIAQRMDRWKSLEVDGAISHLPGLNTQPFDHLERLNLQTRDRALLPLINETATNLRSLTSTLMGLESFETAVWWPTLQHLDLTVPVDSTLEPQTAVLKRVLARAQALESLSLDFHQLQPGSEPLAKLPTLQRLSLYDIPALMPFECPNLTHLHISLGKKQPILTMAPLPTPSSPIYLPHLTHLIFQHPNLVALSTIVAPSLVELVISPQVRIIAPQYNDNAFRAIWNSEKLAKKEILSPQVLRLEDLHVSAASVQNVLEFMTELTSLDLKWVRTDYVAILKALCTSASGKPSNNGSLPGTSLRLCHKLRQLLLHDSSTLRSKDTESMQQALVEIVHVRKTMGYPMKSVICRWPDGLNMEEFRI